jgi:hypothetical protein
MLKLKHDLVESQLVLHIASATLSVLVLHYSFVGDLRSLTWIWEHTTCCSADKIASPDQ